MCFSARTAVCFWIKQCCTLPYHEPGMYTLHGALTSLYMTVLFGWSQRVLVWICAWHRPEGTHGIRGILPDTRYPWKCGPDPALVKRCNCTCCLMQAFRRCSTLPQKPNLCTQKDNLKTKSFSHLRTRTGRMFVTCKLSPTSLVYSVLISCTFLLSSVSCIPLTKTTWEQV